jgi:hypothetical protein
MKNLYEDSSILMAYLPRFNTFFLALLLMLVTPLMTNHEGEATTLRALTLGQLFRLSGLVFQGSITSKTIFEETTGGMWTQYMIHIDEVWKGDQRLTRAPFKLVLRGGELGDGITHRGQVIHAQVNLEEGERGVFFLELTPKGQWVFTGMSQGWFKIVEQNQEIWAVRTLDESHLYGGVKATSFSNIRGDQNHLPLSSLKSRILRGASQPPAYHYAKPPQIHHLKMLQERDRQ